MPPVKEPVQEFFSIGEVCALTGLKPHVLRYWEGQFRFLSPAKNRSGNRVYQRREVELIQLVQQLLYVEKYTIEGAKRRFDELRKSSEQRPAAREALRAATWRAIEEELQAIVRVVQGREATEG